MNRDEIEKKRSKRLKRIRCEWGHIVQAAANKEARLQYERFGQYQITSSPRTSNPTRKQLEAQLAEANKRIAYLEQRGRAG